MRNLILFDDDKRDNLLPLVYTRPCALLRVGILTIQEKWAKSLGANTSFETQAYLSTIFPKQAGEGSIWVNGRVCPNKELVEAITTLPERTRLMNTNGTVIAATGGHWTDNNLKEEVFEVDVNWIDYAWNIFQLNGAEIELDFDLLTAGRQSQDINPTNVIVGAGAVFIEPGAKVNCAVLSTENGSVYIGKDAEVMEGSLIRGPFALCEGASVKMGAKIYGPTTIGPQSKVGGEVNNSVIQGYSNKGHDGFLGNSVLGEWCNLGADTNNSNLKNNYGNVTVWNYKAQKEINTKTQFCGLIMGDHSKCGINTMFNTGTVVGVFANIFGAGFPQKFIPSFTWGGVDENKAYKAPVAIKVAEKVMIRRDVTLSEAEKTMLQVVYDQTMNYRKDY